MSPESLPIKLRQARGTTSLAEAAERSGVSANRIRMYEDGERAPYAKTLRRLAKAYGIPAAELVDLVPARAERAPGDGASAAASRPARRRRRRARVAPDGTATVQVPIEVPAGETVRLVIELIIRSRSSDERRATAGAGHAAADAGKDTPSAADAKPAGEPAGGQRGAAGAAPRAGAPPVRRRRLVRAPGNGGTEAEAGKAESPRDPLDDFRRAYSQFRSERKR